MNVSYACCQCHRTNRQELDESTTTLRCASCGYEQGVPPGAVKEGRVRRCVVCPSSDLFVRKDFSQRLGLTIIVLGFVASSVAWFYYRQHLAFAILVGTALLDVVLYVLVRNLLQCYRCRAEYRGVEGLEAYEGFDLETHERHRQQQARLAEAERQMEARRGPAGGAQGESTIASAATSLKAGNEAGSAGGEAGGAGDEGGSAGDDGGSAGDDGPRGGASRAGQARASGVARQTRETSAD